MKEKTSAENNSGLVLAFRLLKESGRVIMLTGDAGIPAIENAIETADRCGLDLKNNLVFFQMPHHGSIQNLGPTVLNRMFGDPKHSDVDKKTRTAYVSVSKGHDNQHPAKHVINALVDRGVDCYMTNGQTIMRSFGVVPSRLGWVSLSKIERYSQVEETYVS